MKVDLQQLKDAGLYDPAAPGADERRELLEFLASEGCSIAEMQVAESRGRLFALAGDRRIKPLVGLLSMREAGTRLEVDPTHLAHVWRMVGLRVKDLDTPMVTESDLEAFQTYLDIEALVGPDGAHSFARVVGVSLARVTDAVSAGMRAGVDAVSISRSGSELVTAKAFSELTKLVPRVGQLLDTLHRQHLDATRAHFEDIDRDGTDGISLRCGVGFADLSGFTRLSSQLSITELSRVLNMFEDEATHLIAEHNGRIVKFLGDAVMWVSAEPADLVRIAGSLTRHQKATEAGIEVRAGVAYGSVLVQDGDYFGTPVNLASRLVALATPGQVLLAGELVPHLDGLTLEELGAVELRGFDEPVTPYALK